MGLIEKYGTNRESVTLQIPGCEALDCEHNYKEYNVVWDMHYPQGFMGRRSETPDAFAGFNFTQVGERCAHPVRGFHWKRKGSGESTAVVDRGDIPAWIPNERIKPRAGWTSFSAASVSI
eukprot:SAG31_NODE_8281_length_1481_cov_1.415340_2_plen_120_part_00